ncbi:MAG TPA: TVP38/TMEM64 family protein [Marinobacter sp.]|uniref:TVP38/TMEM64 family membrane protein n=2 Tax=root TaxID=1 RepID=A0A831VUS2_9GAMM|nr:TVP38/TMEM64 family protein [Marinobacter antarcticus]HDZ37249.1 TVP38/TMEM64 family protein [Marinobacter sp.]HEA51928.1 TVP38/TMEM64 family protein [Marinobacter antarcticus]
MNTTLKRNSHWEPPANEGIRLSVKTKVAGVLLLLIVFAAIYWILLETGALATVTNKVALREWIDQLGYWGPVGIIGLMIMAIVLSPIPSAPVAMVAGAVYGSFWGTVFVVVGAEAGALIAFAIARSLGYDVIHRWSRVRPVLNWLGKDRSQGTLMLIIFASRLVPFISFDAVSYAAGLTPLAFWRFVVATLAGVIPAAYLITAFGGLLMASESGLVTIVLILVSGITLLPVVAKLFFSRRIGRKSVLEQ